MWVGISGKKAFRFSIGIWLAVWLAAAAGCSSSSDTKSAVRQAETRTLLTKITSPLSGSTILFNADGENENVKFTFTVTGGESPYGYTWSVSGPSGYKSTASGTTSSDSADTQLTFGLVGTYTVTLTVKDANAETANDSITVKVSPDPAVATVVAQITSPSGDISINAGDIIDFKGQGIGGSETYDFAWNIPGGNTISSTEENVDDVTFASAGTYTVTFKVTDSNGLTDTDTVTVKVAAVATALTATITSPGGSGGTITVKSAFTAPVETLNLAGSASGGTGSYTYAWDIPGGSKTSSTDQALTVTFANKGDYLITFTVTDSSGTTATDTVTVTAN